MTEKMLQARKDYSRFGFALLAIILTATILQIGLALVWNGYFRHTQPGSLELMRWLLTMVPLYLVGIPVGLLIMRKIPVEDLPREKLSFKRFFSLLLMCFPIMYGGNYIGTLLSGWLSGGSADNVLLDYIAGDPLYPFIFTVLLAPFLEELVFRKQLIDRLGRYGEKTAIVFSALTFGLIHMNLFQFFYAFGLGLILAYIYTRTRMLRYCVIIHMVINFLGGVAAPTLLDLLDLDALLALENGSLSGEALISMLPGLVAFLVYFLAYMAATIAGLIKLLTRWTRATFRGTSRNLLPGEGAEVIAHAPGMIAFSAFCLVMIVLALF